MKTLPTQPMVQAILIAVVALGSIVRGGDFDAPPRFDGAGYSVLALSLLNGEGYREIDHPDSPRHAHFPPGYPACLALLWAFTGPSFRAAHWFSAACTVAAAVLAFLWMRKVARPTTAWLCGLAVAINWTWARNGGPIQSEPLFLFLSQLAILGSLRVCRHGSLMAAIGLGAIYAACILTRHVGLAMVGALGLDLVLKGQRRIASIALGTALVLVAPWIAWLALVQEQTQIGLLNNGRLDQRIVTLGLFYLQRIPDALVGPFVEVATVFQSRNWLRVVMNGYAIAATTVVSLGWLSALRSRRRRFTGLVPLATMAMLLVWPFTEAGRFLVPLVPFLIVGAVGGFGVSLRKIRSLRAIRLPMLQRWGAIAVLAGSVPFSGYLFVKGAPETSRRTHRAFDLACQWLSKTAPRRTGLVLSRHPGEVYLQTQRQGVAIRDRSELEGLLSRFDVAYLLIDRQRYANASENPLERFVSEHPARVAEVWKAPGDLHNGIAIYELVQP